MPNVPNGDPGCRAAVANGPTAAERLPNGSAVVAGRVRIGGLHTARERWEQVPDPTLRQLLERDAPPPDTAIEVVKPAAGEAPTQLTILDADTHHMNVKPDPEELAAHLEALEPTPEAAWFSHGHGLKLLYTGPYHRQRAVAAAFAVPAQFTVELLDHTRHPRAISSSHPGASCGAVVYYETDPQAPYTFCVRGPLSEEGRGEALQQLGMVPGERYDHDRCPLAPAADSAAKGCVQVLDAGVYCQRCAAHGVRHAAGTKPGFLPFAALVAADLSGIERLATHWIHWPHARLELMHIHPNLDETVLKEAYRLALTAATPYGARDPRIRMVFDPDSVYVWGEGTWLSSRSGEPMRLDEHQVRNLPVTQCLVAGRDAELPPKCVPKPARVSNVRAMGPGGLLPIRPVRGVVLARPAGVVPHVFAPPKHPIRLLEKPMALAEALAALERAFPRLEPLYLQALIAAMICAECGPGQPPMITCDGPSGSGKGETPRLAASFLGDQVAKAKLHPDDEKFARELGVELAGGRRLVLFDEFGKHRDLAARLRPVLEIGSHLSWRGLYKDGQVITACRSAFCFASVRFPDFLAHSTEFARRTRHVPLHRKTPNWARTSGGDTAAWRDRDKAHAHLANSILTHVWELCHAHSFAFFAVADAMGLAPFGDAEGGLDPERLRDLYRHARGEDGRRVLIEDDSFVRGWVNLNSPRARALISAFVCLDDDEDLKRAKAIVRNDLGSVDWNGVLGIEDPPIRGKVRIHGKKWALRFESGEPAMRGRERVNEQLPPIPGDDAAQDPTTEQREVIEL